MTRDEIIQKLKRDENAEYTLRFEYKNKKYVRAVKNDKNQLKDVYYEIKESDLINLGKMYGIKSSDSIYHLFTMNLTGIEPSKDLEVETELEKTSYCGWKILEPSLHSDDAIANALLFKIISKLNLFKNYR